MKRDHILSLLEQHVSKPVAEAILESLEQESVVSTTDYGSADINEVVRTFQECFGTTKVSRYDRFAAARLLKKYSITYLVSVIGLLASKSQERYCPVVNSVSQLEEKMPGVLLFLQRSVGDAQEVDL